MILVVISIDGVMVVLLWVNLWGVVIIVDVCKMLLWVECEIKWVFENCWKQFCCNIGGKVLEVDWMGVQCEVEVGFGCWMCCELQVELLIFCLVQLVFGGMLVYKGCVDVEFDDCLVFCGCGGCGGGFFYGCCNGGGGGIFVLVWNNQGNGWFGLVILVFVCVVVVIVVVEKVVFQL